MSSERDWIYLINIIPRDGYLIFKIVYLRMQNYDYAIEVIT